MRSIGWLVPILFLIFAVILSGCGVSRPPVVEQATPMPTPAVLSIQELMNEPQRWSGQELILITSATIRDNLRVLTSATDPAQATQAVWLAQPPSDNVMASLDDGRGLLRLTGRLSPPGAYGIDQRYPYQFSATSVQVLQPERTTIANLALNPQALDGMALRVEGTLLAQPDGALLVDEVSEGGVPTSGAHQIKLDPAAIDDSVLAELQQSGDVRWGEVEIVGWWQDRTLTPFSVAVRPRS